MQVLTFPENQTAQIGAVRWEVTWWTLRPGAPAGRQEESEDFDYDRDLIEHSVVAPTREVAFKKARSVYRKSFWGCAQVEKQIVDEIDGMPGRGEWVGVGEIEEVA